MELGVERKQRTAHPLPSVPPVRVTTPMPPHIQGAERRQERPAQRAASRWGLRALVIGGLAGAAWLLTGAAAHAADRNDEPDGSLLGSVVDGGTIAPVTGLLQTAVQPLEAAHPAHHQHQHKDIVSTVLDVPQRVLTRPAATVTAIVHDEVPAELPAPTRHTGGTDEAPQQLAPQADETVAHHEDPAETPATVAAETPPAPVVSSAHRPVPAAAVKASARPRHGKAHQHHTVRPARHRAAAPAAAEREASPAVSPGGDGPAAPLQLHLGDASGTTSTSGSGTPTEGGSAAFLPVAIAHSTMACQLLPIVADVEVRRHDAEAPTVSPD